VAIAVSVAFWAACYGVGSAEWALRSFLFDPHRITYLTAASDTILAIDESHVPHVWDGEEREWREVFLTEQQQRIRNQFPIPLPNMTARVYDPRQDLFLAIQRDFSGPRALWAGRESDGWRRLGGSEAPADAMGMFLEPEGTIVVVAQGGVQRLVGDPTGSTEQPDLFGLGRFLPKPQLFEDASDNLPGFPEPHAAAIDAQTGTLSVYSRGRVYLLEKQSDGRYRAEKEVRLETDEDEPAVIALGGGVVLVALRDGAVHELDGQTLAPRAVHRPETSSPPRFAYAAPGGGTLAVLFHNGKLWLFDRETHSLRKPRVAGQGDISAAAFPNAEEILVADRATRVSRYRLDSGKLVRRTAPEMRLLEIVYRYAVVPLYTVFPKPSELYKTSQYLITGKETATLDDDEDDLSEPQVKLRPWQPVWSSLVFVIVMLALACLYFERQEF
jgi:hypothetical protein